MGGWVGGERGRVRWDKECFRQSSAVFFSWCLPSCVSPPPKRPRLAAALLSMWSAGQDVRVASRWRMSSSVSLNVGSRSLLSSAEKRASRPYARANSSKVVRDEILCLPSASRTSSANRSLASYSRAFENGGVKCQRGAFSRDGRARAGVCLPWPLCARGVARGPPACSTSRTRPCARAARAGLMKRTGIGGREDKCG